jgi:hypothetical protein
VSKPGSQSDPATATTGRAPGQSGALEDLFQSLLQVFDVAFGRQVVLTATDTEELQRSAVQLFPQFFGVISKCWFMAFGTGICEGYFLRVAHPSRVAHLR